MSIQFIEDNDQTRARREHLAELHKLVGNVYPNRFERSNITHSPEGEDTITAIVKEFGKFSLHTKDGEKPAPETIASVNEDLNRMTVRLSGRIATPPRVMGKAAFVHLSDGRERLQIYVRKADAQAINNDTAAPINDPADAGWQLFNLLDHGDFIGVSGFLFITKTGELSVHVHELQFLSKALLPMPDKMHGISDPEIRQRQRYADLIAGSLKVKIEEETASEQHELTPREVFERRSKTISAMRRFLDEHGYIEVETPMLTPLATGAAAKPFITHHNALDIDLYARIAPELYLKRLLVGGIERVYELNRNFRNEGIDRTHNPEFTMLEFYCAYMDVNGMMDFCEEMIRTTVEKATGSTTIKHGNEEIDFSKFQRLTMKEAIAYHWPASWSVWSVFGGKEFNLKWLDDGGILPQLFRYSTTTEAMLSRNYDYVIDEGWSEMEAHTRRDRKTAEIMKRVNESNSRDNDIQQNELEDAITAQYIEHLFANVAEEKLIQPTFIYDFPKAISPLSKASSANPAIAERFELFINGMECANGFSELNDPEEQYKRFLEQVQQRERGDEEAMMLDTDYIRALSYGMPPAAGIGIGIDRLVMLLTNRQSIRDVILFPHMRPEHKTDEQAAKDEDPLAQDEVKE